MGSGNPTGKDIVNEVIAEGPVVLKGVAVNSTLRLEKTVCSGKKITEHVVAPIHKVIWEFMN